MIMVDFQVLVTSLVGVGTNGTRCVIVETFVMCQRILNDLLHISLLSALVFSHCYSITSYNLQFIKFLLKFSQH